jgi:hypothetical protein
VDRVRIMRFLWQISPPGGVNDSPDGAAPGVQLVSDLPQIAHFWTI